MSRSTAERWVTISAVLVIGIYAYRRLTEQPATPVKAKQLAGVGPPAPLGTFATAWGFTFMTVAIMAEAAPGLGGAFAILIATADFLTNTSSVLADVTKLEHSGAQQAASGTAATGQTQVIAGTVNPNQAQGGAQIVAGQTSAGIGQLGQKVAGF
jgi:hypothetical protein